MTQPTTSPTRAALRHVSGLAEGLLLALAALAHQPQHTASLPPALVGLLEASRKRVEKEVLVLRSLARMVEALALEGAANDDQVEAPTVRLSWVPGPLTRAELEEEAARLQAFLRAALVSQRSAHGRLRLKVTRASLRAVSRARGELGVAEARARAAAGW